MIPVFIILVPYRDRARQRAWLQQHLSQQLLQTDPRTWELWFLHQANTLPFNRGAMRNLVYLFVRSRYPTHYADITLVFHDVDTAPASAGLFDYATTPGAVKHFYGLEHCLGGIVSIRAADFERTEGYPNYWSWGYEDNLFQDRVLRAGLQIDRSQFAPMGHPSVHQFNDEGPQRWISRSDIERYVRRHSEDTNDGWRDLRALQWVVEEAACFVHVVAFVSRHPPGAMRVIDASEHKTLLPFLEDELPLPKKRRGL